MHSVIDGDSHIINPRSSHSYLMTGRACLNWEWCAQ